MALVDPVPATEFTRNFGHYKMLAQRAAVAVSSHGQVAGYFVRADEYEALLRFRSQRHSFATTELSTDRVQAIAAARMDERHEHLNALLEE